MRRVAYFACAWVICLAGCATLPPGHDEPLVFEMVGRVAMRHGGEATSARVHWRHGDNHDDLLITSPIGQGIARIVRSGISVTLETGDNRRFSAQSAEALTQEVLGWRIPLSGQIGRAHV